ncbi:THO complex [Nesidiocoris tenuis]|nr:THO complex [Nesidiocoris tenuis]
MVNQKVYNCILSQVLSTCGDLLVCGNIYGDIAVFDLAGVLSGGEEHSNSKGPKCSFKSPNGEQICSLASTGRFLIVGTVGAIFGYGWDSIKNDEPRTSWTINLPSSREGLQNMDVNSMLVLQTEADSDQLFAGCGDNNIYCFSLETGKALRIFDGHTDYIHSLSSCGSQIASASEDGTVRLWDMRRAALNSKIEPQTEPKLCRNQFGKWIGDVSITGDWLVCGGGPRCSLWHMRTMEMMTAFTELPDFEVHIAQLQGESVLCGGASSNFYVASLTGQVTSKMTTSTISLNSALYSNTPRNVLTLAGSSNKIDVCTNFTYRHQVLNFYA